MADEERVACRTPAEGKGGVSNIPKWKFDRLSDAILKIVGMAGSDGMLNKDLRDAVGAELSGDELERLGKLGWHVVTVKLELEVRGEIRRLDVKGPMRIVLGGSC